jgi:heme/copper-type cytochrome/quinol oxidase subunit 1
MFTVGLDIDTRAYFGSITVTIGVPTAIKLFNWLYTLVLSRTMLATECLYLALFLLMFFFGGLTGLILANVQLDVQLHDTYFVVAHFHYVLSLGAVVGTLSAMYALINHVIGLEAYTMQLKGNFMLFVLGSNLGRKRGPRTT